MSDPRVIYLSLPGLREADLTRMPHLSALVEGGGKADLRPSFPCVTWPVQSTMLTGAPPDEHGVMANGFFWRESGKVEMWTAGNRVILAEQIWDRLHQCDKPFTSAVWFPMLSKECGADYVCMPAPIHNPDGSESLWCYTKPVELYGELRDALGHFPLKHFWGPLAGIPSTRWIVDSAIYAAEKWQPHFFYLYLPHLDYAAQKQGPDSEEAMQALGEIDEVIASLVQGFNKAYGTNSLTWLAASEYVITAVDHVTYPNRVLREAGLLTVVEKEEGEYLDTANSAAWAMVDHQFSHIFVRDRKSQIIDQVMEIFSHHEGIAEVLAGRGREKYHIDHERAGDLILISSPRSWQAYYWWLDDEKAPSFARTVDIHQKPGYDPVELFFDPATKGIPLDASLVKGSHGAPATQPDQQGVLLSSAPDLLPSGPIGDNEISDLILGQFNAAR